MDNYIVYKHTTPSNKVYIGITCQTPSQRWKNGKGYKYNQAFYKAIKKYGWENIKHEILFDSLTKEQAEQKEIELIALYKSNQKKFGYNISNGGGSNKGFLMSEEQKLKISKANSGEKNGMYGKRFKQSPEALQKFKTYCETRDYNGGNNPKAKAVLQTTPDGSFVKEWQCIKSASSFLGVSYSYLIKIMKLGKVFKGFLWSYKGGEVSYGG